VGAISSLDPATPHWMKARMSATTSRSPDWFLDEIVQPTLDDYSLHRECIRRGMLAALAVSSLADHIAVAESKRSGLLSLHSPGAPLPKGQRKKVFAELGDFRGGLAGRCGDFALVHDVADATKHARLDRDDARIKDVSGVQRHVEVVVGRDGRAIVMRDGSPLATGGVVVALPDGSRHLLAKLLDGAIASLRKEMGR
jgi:hypothetical protein